MREVVLPGKKTTIYHHRATNEIVEPTSYPLWQSFTVHARKASGSLRDDLFVIKVSMTVKLRITNAATPIKGCQNERHIPSEDRKIKRCMPAERCPIEMNAACKLYSIKICDIIEGYARK